MINKEINSQKEARYQERKRGVEKGHVEIHQASSEMFSLWGQTRFPGTKLKQRITAGVVHGVDLII